MKHYNPNYNSELQLRDIYYKTLSILDHLEYLSAILSDINIKIDKIEEKLDIEGFEDIEDTESSYESYSDINLKF